MVAGSDRRAGSDAKRSCSRYGITGVTRRGLAGGGTRSADAAAASGGLHIRRQAVGRGGGTGMARNACCLEGRLPRGLTRPERGSAKRKRRVLPRPTRSDRGDRGGAVFEWRHPPRRGGHRPPDRTPPAWNAPPTAVRSPRSTPVLRQRGVACGSPLATPMLLRRSVPGPRASPPCAGKGTRTERAPPTAARPALPARQPAVALESVAAGWRSRPVHSSPAAMKRRESRRGVPTSGVPSSRPPP